MATTDSISSALKLIDAKKNNLKRAFEDLQSHSSSLSSFNLSWADLDSYFTSLQSDLNRKFALLHTLQPVDQSKQTNESETHSVPAPTRPDLKELCERLDGIGLTKYIASRVNERTKIRSVLPVALRCAPDPAKLVLDAMLGFYGPGVGAKLSGVRRACVVLLEELVKADVKIGDEVKGKARELADEWKRKMQEELEKLGYLNLLAAFRLVGDDGIDVNELVDYAVDVAGYRNSGELCRVLGLEDQMSDVIQKLIRKGEQFEAVKYAFEFKLTDKFPPVPLLKAYVSEAKKLANEDRESGKKKKGAIGKEMNALKSVIKFIHDHNLESEYKKDSLLKRIKTLKKEKADGKRPAAAPSQPQQKFKKLKQGVTNQQKLGGAKQFKKSAPKPQKQRGPKYQKSGMKRKPPNAPAGWRPRHEKVPGSLTIMPLERPVQTAGFMLDRPVSYPSSAAGAYGTASSSLGAAQYVGSSPGMYVMSEIPASVSGNLHPSATTQYSSESHMQLSYYDRPTAIGGHGLPPEHHRSYYPQ